MEKHALRYSRTDLRLASQPVYREKPRSVPAYNAIQKVINDAYQYPVQQESNEFLVNQTYRHNNHSVAQDINNKSRGPDQLFIFTYASSQNNLNYGGLVVIGRGLQHNFTFK